MQVLLETRDLRASYGQIEVLHGIDIRLRQGEVCALLGANGAGKTTTLRALSQLGVKTTGVIEFQGKRIDGLRTDQIAKLGVGHVPDGRGTFLALSAEENLQLGASTRQDRSEIGADLERVYEYFPRLRERYRQQAGTLSGGEQQMLAIGRALMGRPTLLMLDEPSFGLAPLVVQEIFAIMRRINQEESVSILLVEQNANLALQLADTAYLIESGRIALSGSAGEMRKDGSVRKAYLGG